MDKVFHMGFDLPSIEIERILEIDDGMPVQTIKFANAITSSFLSAGFKVEMISTQPVLNYPKNRKIFYKGRRFKKGNNIGFIVPFLNVLVFKHITRFVSVMLLMLYRNFMMVGRKEGIVIVHGVHLPFLIASYVMKVFFSYRVFVFVTDPPEMSGHGVLDLFLRKINASCIYFFLNRATGLILLSEQLHIDHKLNPPYLVLDGFLDESMEPIAINKVNDKLKIGYAGLLDEKYGVKTLVEAIAGNNVVELYVFGKGDCEDFIAQSSIDHDNIFFEGFISPNMLYHNLQEVDVMVNPRPVELEFAKYSFPSKTIEYMAMGKLLLTTRIYSIGSEYEDYVTFFDGSTALDISSKVNELALMPLDEIRSKAIEGMKFIRNTRSVKAQGVRIKKFILEFNNV